MDIIEKALSYVKAFFENEFSGHDYFHTLRVFRLATHIAMAEKADLKIVQLAALLHDVDDRKLSPETCEGKENARRFLAENQVDDVTAEKIITIIGFPLPARTPSPPPPWRENAPRMQTGWMPSAPSVSAEPSPSAATTTG